LGDEKALVVINYSDGVAEGRVIINDCNTPSLDNKPSDMIELVDMFTGSSFYHPTWLPVCLSHARVLNI
jgi:hypothetical protein